VRRESRKLTMPTMHPSQRQDRVNDLRDQLRELEEQFDREMRMRGFDPAQAENIALPSHLARLYADREQIKAKLEELEGKTND